MSEAFVVSARKYRPSTFSTVVGQDHITQTLKKAIVTNHLAQAYLFTGPRGIGKTTCARILAKAINCLNISAEGEPCNECASCVTFNQQRSMNIFELDAASNNSVDDIRALVDQIRFAPQGGKYKTYIIDEVHMLSANAFNAFLKTLEEPPPYAIFILATTEKQKIIPTILSRCQIMDFNRISVKDIAKHLQDIAVKEHITAEETALHLIAQKADGALRDALTIFDRIVSFTKDEIKYDYVISNLNIIDYDQFFQIADFVLQKDDAGVLLAYNNLLSLGFDGINLLNGLSEHFRNLLVSQLPQAISLLDIPDTIKGRYAIQSGKFSKSVIITMLSILNQYALSYRDSKNHRIHTELALLKLCHVADAINLAKELQEQKKKADIEIKSPKTQEQQPSDQTAQVVHPKYERGSLKDFNNLDKLKTLVENNNSKSDEKTDEQETTVEDAAVETDKLKEIWNEYLENELSKKSKSLYSSLKNCQADFIDNKCLRVYFENEALNELFIKEKGKIIDYFAEQYQVHNFRIVHEVKTLAVEEKAIYMINPKEKYFYMAEQNPELEKLQQALGLQPEE